MTNDTPSPSPDDRDPSTGAESHEVEPAQETASDSPASDTEVSPNDDAAQGPADSDATEVIDAEEASDDALADDHAVAAAQTEASSARRRIIDFPRAKYQGWRRWVPSWKLLLGGAATAGVAAMLALAAAVILTPMPQPNEIARAQATTFYWNDATTVLGRTGDANRTSVEFEQIPEDAQHAVLAAEDRSFYQHTGFDVVGIARAARNNITGDTSGMQGGSTITQQYAKNAFLTQDQTLVRKAKELVLSLKLELASSKEEILTDYLNTVYYGRGAYGIEAASTEYFGIPAEQLDASQAAVLAALIASPNALSPEENPEGLQERWAYVLDSMVDQGWLTAEERANTAFPEIAPYKPLTEYYSGPNGFLLAAAQQELLEQGFTEEDLLSGGLSVITTFDMKAQWAAIDAVNNNKPTEDAEGVRIGLASVATDTGAIKALYGGEDYAANKFNNATQARGQAGSTFKAFGLTAGLRNGISLNTTYSGASPMTIADYKVNNYGDVNYGNVSMLTSTVNSINTPFVQMNDDIGGDKTYQAIVAAGIPMDTPGLGTELNNVLGSASPTPLEQARAFATFATRGERIETTMLGQVRGQKGEVLYQWQPQRERTIDENVVDEVTYALRQVVSSGTGTAARQTDRPVAGKTGTSDDFKSAWFAGYTPQMSTAVMLVRNDEQGNSISLSGMGGMSEVTGGSVPARIFGDYTAVAMDGMPAEQFTEPKPSRTATPQAPRQQTPQRQQPVPVVPSTPVAPAPSPAESSEAPPVTPSPVVPSPVAPVVPSPVPPPPPPAPTPTQAPPVPTPPTPTAATTPQPVSTAAASPPPA